MYAPLEFFLHISLYQKKSSLQIIISKEKASRKP